MLSTSYVPFEYRLPRPSAAAAALGVNAPPPTDRSFCVVS